MESTANDLSHQLCDSEYTKQRKISSHKSRKKRKRERSSSTSNYSSSENDDDHSTLSKLKKKKQHHRKEKSHKHKKHKHKKKSKTYDSDSSSDEKERKKKKEKKRKKKKKLKKEKTEDFVDKPKTGGNVHKTLCPQQKDDGPKATVRIMQPMTKEMWKKQQSITKRVYDPETGRNRLVRGDGEIIEEIVSKERHKEINKQATMGDGLYFQAKMGLLK